MQKVLKEHNHTIIINYGNHYECTNCNIIVYKSYINNKMYYYFKDVDNVICEENILEQIIK
jgi:hypothetical protein